MGKYSMKNKTRPLVLLKQIGHPEIIAVVSQETDKSYILRNVTIGNYNGQVRALIAKESGWIRKTTITIIGEIGIYSFNGEPSMNINAFSYRNFSFVKTKLNFNHYTCPKCLAEIKTLEKHSSYIPFSRTCPSCGNDSKIDEYKVILFSVIDNLNRYIAIQDEMPEKTQNKDPKIICCPNCKEDNDFIDKMNKIKKCVKCGTYYVG